MSNIELKALDKLSTRYFPVAGAANQGNYLVQMIKRNERNIGA